MFEDAAILYRKFFSFIEEEASKEPHNLFILQGKQLHLFLNEENILKYPTVIIGTDKLISDIKSMQKNNKKPLFVKILRELKNSERGAE